MSKTQPRKPLRPLSQFGTVAADASDAPAGIVCLNCGCRHFRVIYTRRAAGGRVIRRRECRNCEERITTVEQERGDAVPERV